MSKHLLLEGPSGTGKTTLLLKALGPLRQRAAGFVTQRMVDEKSRTRGFCLTRAKAAKTALIPFREDQPGIFLRDGSKMPDNRVFRDTGVELLHKQECDLFYVLDEIGGVELQEPLFYSALTELFLKNIPCIGVLKSELNFKHLAVNLAFPNESILQYRIFRERLQQNPNVEIVGVDKQNLPETEKKVKNFMKQIEVKM